MKDYLRVYLSGGIKNAPKEDASKWREYIKTRLEDCSNNIRCFNPFDYYNYDDAKLFGIAEKEVMAFELSSLRKSDVVVVNTDDTTSIGTAMEVAIAHELKIPIIGLSLNSLVEDDIHPWISECCDTFFRNEDDVITYILNYYANY